MIQLPKTLKWKKRNLAHIFYPKRGLNSGIFQRNVLFPSLIQCNNSLQLPMQTSNRSVICKFRSPETSTHPQSSKHTPVFFGTPKSPRIWFDLRGCPIGGCPIGGGGQAAPLAPPPPPRGYANGRFSGSANGFEIGVHYFTHSQSMLLIIFEVGKWSIVYSHFIINYGVLFHFKMEGERCARNLKTTLIPLSASVETEW